MRLQRAFMESPTDRQAASSDQGEGAGGMALAHQVLDVAEGSLWGLDCWSRAT